MTFDEAVEKARTAGYSGTSQHLRRMLKFRGGYLPQGGTRKALVMVDILDSLIQDELKTASWVSLAEATRMLGLTPYKALQRAKNGAGMQFAKAWRVDLEKMKHSK